MSNVGVKRNEWIESVRVLAMLFIIMSHISSSYLPAADKDSISSELLSFLFQPVASLAVFFFLAGYFTRKEMPVRKWIGRIFALLIPYFIWNGLFAFGLNDEVTWGRVFAIGSGFFLCADYPLWFVLAIIYMTILWPIWRFSPEIALIICLVFSCCGNNWNCQVLTSLPMPPPSTCSIFLCGVCAGRFSLAAMQKFFTYLFIPLLFVVILAGFYYSLPQVLLHIVFPCFILSFMACCAGIFPSFVSIIARYSHTVFFSYATHAGIIFSLGIAYRASTIQCDALLSEMYIPLTLMIFIFNIFVFKLMERYIPWILPFVAHYGKLPWLRKRNTTSSIVSD